MSEYVANDIIYLHIPKTGGNWLRTVLRSSGIKEVKSNKISKHATYDLLVGSNRPGLFEKKQTNYIRFFCVVRHPLLWYESWFNYQHTKGWRDFGVGGCFNSKKWHCLSPLNTSRKNDFNDFMKFANDRAPGFLTYLYHSFVLSSGARVLKNESLRDDLSDLNQEWNLGLNEEFLQSSDRVNVSKKSKIFWTEENLSKTIENEKALLNRYCYNENPESLVQLKV